MLSPQSTREEQLWQRIAVTLLSVLAITMAVTFTDYGVTWDEFNHITYGREILEWYKSGFENRAAVDHRAYNLLGGAFDATTAALADLTDLPVVTMRHATGAVLGWVGLLFSYRLAALLGGARAGVFVLLALALIPVYYGHAFANPKDAPLAALFAIATYYIVRTIPMLPRVPWRLVARLGIAIGAALGLRVIAISLLFYWGLAFALFLALDYWSNTEARGQRALRSIRHFAPRFAAAAVIAYLIMLVFWPAAQLDPIGYVLSAIQRTQTYSWNLPVLFEGELVRARHLPRSYVLQWMMISLPEFVFIGLVAAAIAGVQALRSRVHPDSRWIAYGVLAFAIGFPLAYQTYRHSSVYDAWRHFLFLVPPLAVLTGCGLSALLAAQGRLSHLTKWPLVAAAGVSAALTLMDMIQLHPYQTVYFNRLVAGGVARAAKSYETDYWGSSYKEGVEWLERNYRVDAAPGSIRVGSCSHPFLVTHYLDTSRFVYVGDPTETGLGAEITLATTRWNCHKRVGGATLHVVRRKGANLLYVMQTPLSERPPTRVPLRCAPPSHRRACDVEQDEEECECHERRNVEADL